MLSISSTGAIAPISQFSWRHPFLYVMEYIGDSLPEEARAKHRRRQALWSRAARLKSFVAVFKIGLIQTHL